MVRTICGGCAHLGSHRKTCPKHPNYHPWYRLQLMATEIGDSIGSNDTEASNEAYFLAGRIQSLIVEHPWRKRPE